MAKGSKPSDNLTCPISLGPKILVLPASFCKLSSSPLNVKKVPFKLSESMLFGVTMGFKSLLRPPSNVLTVSFFISFFY